MRKGGHGMKTLVLRPASGFGQASAVPSDERAVSSNVLGAEARCADVLPVQLLAALLSRCCEPP